MTEHKEAPKHFMDGFGITSDTELVQEVYRRFDENSRLNKSQAARVEFLTTVKYIERYLTVNVNEYLSQVLANIRATYANEYLSHLVQKYE